MRFVLASQSPYRQAQLKAFGLPFVTARPKVDEEKLKNLGPSDLVELTRFLAQKKAESVREDFPDSVWLGSDQIAELDGQRLDKPGSFEKARAQLLAMQGQTHRLLTSLAVLSGPHTLLFTDITLVKMRALRASEIEAYLNADQPFDCAGSYKVEKAGLGLVESIDGKDPSAIQGLPLISLSTALRQLGLPVWRV